MKKLLLATAVLALLPSSVPAETVPERRVVFSIEQIKYGNDTGRWACEGMCHTAGSGEIGQYQDSGWRVVSSRNKTVVTESFREEDVMFMGNNLTRQYPFDPPRLYGCECIGIEYIMERFVER